VKGELGEVLAGLKNGRKTNNEITIFKSLGIAIEDIYAANYVYEMIMQKNSMDNGFTTDYTD